MPDIRHQLVIGSSPAKIYQAITSQQGLAAWWTPDTRALPEVNSILHFGFGPEFYKEMKILELLSNQSVKWVCITGADEWVGTSISFSLEASDEIGLLDTHDELKDQVQQQRVQQQGTILSFRHDNWSGYTPMFAECNYTWGRFLWSLKLYCETGKGLPWPSQHVIQPS